MDNRKYAELLESYQEKTGKSNKTLATEFGVHRNTIGNWLKGKDIDPEKKNAILFMCAPPERVKCETDIEENILKDWRLFDREKQFQLLAYIEKLKKIV